MSDYTYKFGAILGQQNGRPFYQATVPFRVLASLLKLDDNFDVNKRSQRLVEKSRAKKVTKYLTKNKDGFWILPPLVGFIEGYMDFESVPLDGWSTVGRLHVSLDSKIMLFDGQHRAFGIREAMALEPVLAQENISIMFFYDLSLADRKQAFHDINFTQKTPSNALCIAYNERSDFDKMVVDVFSQSHIRSLIEYEKNTASGKSDKIYSLKTLKDFAVNLVGSELKEDTREKLTFFVDALFDVVNIPSHICLLELENKDKIKNGYVAAKEYRQNYITGHAVTIKAFGLLGNYFYENDLTDLAQALSVFNEKSVFSRSNHIWLNSCVNEHDKMQSNALAVRLTFYKMKELCDLPLTESELTEQSDYLNKFIG